MEHLVFWTKFLRRIHHDRWRQLQTVHLGLELFHLLLLQRSPTTQQIQVQRLPPGWVHDPPHYSTIRAGCVEEGAAELEAALPRHAEGAALKWDVVGPLLALLSDAIDLGVGEVRLAGVGEVSSNAASLLQGFHDLRVVDATCDEGPSTLQMIQVNLIKRSDESFTDGRSRLASAQQAEQNGGMCHKHQTGGDHHSMFNSDLPDSVTKCEARSGGWSSIIAAGKVRVHISGGTSEELCNQGKSHLYWSDTWNTLICVMEMWPLSSSWISVCFFLLTVSPLCRNRMKPWSSESSWTLSVKTVWGVGGGEGLAHCKHKWRTLKKLFVVALIKKFGQKVLILTQNCMY